MNIFSFIKRYDPVTGAPVMNKVFKELRCDFTGAVIDQDYNQLYCSYQLDYGDSDSCFGSDGDEFEFGKKYKVPTFQFLSGEYHFMQDCDNDIYAEKDMMKEFDGHVCFHEMCREVRIKTATRLIEDGTITADQLYDRLA